ncbi:ejaculatory bulb-specific protein 3-like [Apis dorsata]|uniref:ejaculatory bulb-specific protein 3-like n=1 Tax=Apis dorsata TaxID=7462 RepID=UPI0003DF6694|nr:ejaculatory bulb-specific protein 3-like [Apis dorsata]
MKTILIALVAVCFLLGEVFSEDKYTTKYDNVDIDVVLNTERLLNGYVNCLLDQGPCTPDAAELKKNLPDALENECSPCSEKQKEIADKVVQFLIDNKPEIWVLLEAKYDPTGAYRQHYLQNRVKEESD